MNNYPELCIVDTNVPANANKAVNPDSIPNDLASCVLECVNAIEHVVKKGKLVIDSGDEIFNEYKNNLSMHGQPGVGDKFMKWVHDNRWGFPDKNRVSINKNGDSFDEFPTHEELTVFDVSDRKFIAVANAHPENPTIFESTDSKWWGWKDALESAGIAVRFLCPDYISSKYFEKME